ncbi:hypothetical protein HanIR_Chr09g0420191 [Helianthus annuus]|nr:hypothetical protein HanIR_Chr09g0420191 [Helianthus annuus]
MYTFLSSLPVILMKNFQQSGLHHYLLVSVTSLAGIMILSRSTTRINIFSLPTLYNQNTIPNHLLCADSILL